jgi:hypothetical protein
MLNIGFFLQCTRHRTLSIFTNTLPAIESFGNIQKNHYAFTLSKVLYLMIALIKKTTGDEPQLSVQECFICEAD